MSTFKIECFDGVPDDGYVVPDELPEVGLPQQFFRYINFPAGTEHIELYEHGVLKSTTTGPLPPGGGIYCVLKPQVIRKYGSDPKFAAEFIARTSITTPVPLES